MASPNYGFEKRKKEMAKKEKQQKKQQQKQQQKLVARNERSRDDLSLPPSDELKQNDS
jgi:hypothetical protein